MKLTKEELAARLNGREYGSEIEEAEETEAKRAGLVVVFGYSDDNAEFRGAICDEIGCGEDSEIPVTKGGILPEPDFDEEETLRKYGVLDQVEQASRKIKTIWDRDGYSWQYETDIPHATFEVMEGGAKYCRGIVFSIEDLIRQHAEEL